MLVSVIIPARRWDAFLQTTLATLERQDLPVGVSTEKVVALAEETPSGAAVGVRVVHNPSGTIPDGLNLAIAASSGDVVVRVDSRCDLQPDHVRRIVERLSDDATGCVGGAALVLDRGLFGSTYAVAFNSVLLGPSKYRYSRRSGPADTAYLGAWRRADLEALGGFNPQLIRNQDNDLADRIRDAGGIVWYDAGLVVGYHNARDLRGALAHHHEFGMWRMFQRGQGSRTLTKRHIGSLGVLASAAIVVGSSLARRTSRPYVLGAGVFAYAAAGAYAWRSATRLRRCRPDIPEAALHPLSPVLAPALAAMLNGAWLAGLLRGALTDPPAAQTARVN